MAASTSSGLTSPPTTLLSFSKTSRSAKPSNAETIAMSKPAEIIQDAVPPAAEDLSQPLTIGNEAYISEAYARAERDKLWCKVWLQVGRVEEIPEVGNFLTYDILDDSFIIARS